MNDIVLGILAVVVGGLFCFRGYLALRLLMPIWGAFAGFTFGAGLIAAVTNEGFLGTVLGWIVGIGFALVFAMLAYLYYAVSVVVAMGFIGFALGAGLMNLLDVTWTWVVVLVGIAAGVALALLAIVVDLPMGLLVVLSAVGGASVMTSGMMLLVGAVNTDDFTDASVTSQVDDRWWWYAIYVGLVVVGLVVQIRSAQQLRMSMREAWEADRTGRPARA